MLDDGDSVALRPPADRDRRRTRSARRCPGIDLPNVHRVLDAGRRARDRGASRKPGARVLQMGAGFIGCIILEALAARGVKLTVVEMGDRMVPRMMTEGAGNMIKRWVEGKGRAGSTRRRASRRSRPAPAPHAVRLSNGRQSNATW